MILADLSLDKCYLAPYNNLTRYLSAHLRTHNKTILGFLDNRQKGPHICNTNQMDENIPILIFSPNYYYEIYKTLPSDSVVYFVAIHKGIFYFFEYKSIISLIPYWLYLKKHEISIKLMRKYHNFVFKIASNKGICINQNTKKLLNLQNTHKNRIFIIGNGPSLRMEDLEKLHGETTIACNKIFLAFEQTKWRPSYYTIEDPLDLFEYYHQIRNVDLGIKFFSERALWHFQAIPDALYYKQANGASFNKIKLSDNLLQGIAGGESVALSMLQFALFLGSNEIYLLGFDHFYKDPTNYENSTYKISDSEENHFHKDYRQKGDMWTEPRVENITVQFQLFHRYAEENNINVFNATRGGHLEVFKRVNFDSLFCE